MIQIIVKSGILLTCLYLAACSAEVNKPFVKRSPKFAAKGIQQASQSASEQLEKIEQEKQNAVAAKEQKLKNFVCFCTSTKVDRIVKQAFAEQVDEYDDFALSLTSDKFDKFNTREKLIFAVNYPEQYTQSCAMSNPHNNLSKNLFKNIPRVMEGRVMSERQISALKNHRDSAIFYLTKCLENSSFVSNEYRELILELNAIECIPQVISMIENGTKTDNYLLTVLMQLMKQNKYKPFKETKTYKTLYPKSYSPVYFIPLTQEIQEQICQLASAFHLSKGFSDIQMR